MAFPLSSLVILLELLTCIVKVRASPLGDFVPYSPSDNSS